MLKQKVLVLAMILLVVTGLQTDFFSCIVYADEEDFREFDELDFGYASVDSLINETENDLEANANWIAAWTLQDN